MGSAALSSDLPKGSALPTAGLRASESGCKEQISWELISQNTKTQLTPCKAFWANIAE